MFFFSLFSIHTTSVGERYPSYWTPSLSVITTFVLSVNLKLGSMFNELNTDSHNKILKEKIKLSQKIEKYVKYSNNFKVNVAVLEFRTSSNEVSRLNQLIQRQIHQSLATYNNFKVIEQYSVNHILEEQGWSLENANSFKVYSTINENLFRNTGTIADVFLYGVISMDNENVSITGFIVPGGVASNGSKITVKISVNNLPENYLEND